MQRWHQQAETAKVKLDAIAEFKLARQPTSLTTYMHIYQKANHECYIDYMEGAVALAKYLAPIRVLTAPSNVPSMLRSYELHKLALAILPYTSIPMTSQDIEDAIYHELS